MRTANSRADIHNHKAAGCDTSNNYIAIFICIVCISRVGTSQ